MTKTRLANIIFENIGNYTDDILDDSMSELVRDIMVSIDEYVAGIVNSRFCETKNLLIDKHTGQLCYLEEKQIDGLFHVIYMDSSMRALVNTERLLSNYEYVNKRELQ